VLTLGFLVYLVSSLSSVQRYGWLSALACVAALFIDLVLSPALVRSLEDR